MNALAFHPEENRFVAVGSTGPPNFLFGPGSIQWWETTTGNRLGAPWILPTEVYAVAISPDGKTLLTGGASADFLGFAAIGKKGQGDFLIDDSATARLWDIETRKPVSKPLAHVAPVQAGAFSPNGKTVVTQCSGGARVWEATTGRALGHYLEHPGGVDAVCYLPDSRTILTGSKTNGSVHIWQIPEPLPGDVERIVLWVQVLTGRELAEHGEVRMLSAQEWEERRQRQQALGGPPSS